MKQLHHLTDIQLEILNVIWARGEATVAQVHDALIEHTGQARKTVGTLMARLEKQGVLAYRVDAREHVYRATVSRGEVGRATVSNVLQRLFGGSVPALLSHALQGDEVDPGDVEKVRQLLDAWDKEDGRHG